MRLFRVMPIVLAVAACDRHDAARQAAAPAPAAMFVSGGQQGAGLHLAYTHDVALEVDGATLARHFLAARDRCLGMPALHCILMHAEIGGAGEDGGGSAILGVRLPHDQVAGFADGLTQLFPGEAAGAVRVVRQSSSAEDLGQVVADSGQRVAQLTDYLASLKVVGARLTISVADQVKIAAETAQTQTQLEEAQARQRELALRVDTEELDVTFAARVVVRQVDPVAVVWAGAEATLRRSSAEALAFGLAAVPWVPVGLVGLLVLWVVRRVVFGRRG